MPSLKDLRNRINSVKATRKITKAMQMVAAAKLRRAQEAAEAVPALRRSVWTWSWRISPKGVANPENASPLLVGTGKEDTHLLIMMTAERGLCGGFNSNIAKLVRQDSLQLIKDGKKVKILAVGRKGADNLRRDLGNYITDRVSLAGLKTVGFEQASEIADKVMAGFGDEEFDVCTVYYAQFESVISQKPTGQQLIPARLPEASDDAAAADGHGNALLRI